MNNFKFRVWDNIRNDYRHNVIKSYLKSFFIDENGILFALGYDNELVKVDQDDFIVEWFTGLHFTREKKEVYQGDIVKIIGEGYLDIGSACFDDEWTFTGEVVFCDYQCTVFGDGVHFPFCFFMDDSVCAIEVLGNIHTHKHLLEGE